MPSATAKTQTKRTGSGSLKIPLLKATLVHSVLLILLMVSFQSRKEAEEVLNVQVKPQPIQARAVSSEEVERLVQNKKDKELAKKREQQRKIRVQQENKRKADLEKKKRAEAQKKKRLEDARKKKLVEEARKKKLAEEKKRKEAAEQKKRQAEDARKKRLAEEAERKKREAAQEQQRLANEQRVLSEVDKYTAFIKNKISRNWIIGQNTGKCILEVRLVSSGQLTDVRQVGGDPDLCRSAMAAVYKSEPLPVSTDPSVFRKMRVLRLTLDPQDK